MRKVVILSGVSGSGKSTYADKLVREARESSDNVYAAIVSADTYFMSDGEYKFDPTKLGEAHGACFRQFITCMQTGENLLIVDNTNTTETEIAPYILGAQAFGYEAEILTFTPGHSMNWVDYYVRCAERNKHGVGFDTVKAQHLRLANRRLPPWWKNTDILPESI